MHDHERSDGFRTFDEMNDAFRNSSDLQPFSYRKPFSHIGCVITTELTPIFSAKITSDRRQIIKTDIIAGPTNICRRDAKNDQVTRARRGGGGSGLAMDCKARTDGRSDRRRLDDGEDDVNEY